MNIYDLLEKARVLDLVSKVYADDSLNEIKTSIDNTKDDSFQFIIVIDFETTCWPNQRRNSFRKNEIIEFPAVFFDLNAKKILHEFREIIKPTENPILSDYCSDFTGITQEEVDNGILINDALLMFCSWIQYLSQKYTLTFPMGNYNGNCAFVTWSNCDLGEFLRYECMRKCIQIPNILNAWIDLRHLFMTFMKKKPLNLRDALNLVGLEFEGREHSGICDAKNTAFLASKLYQLGSALTITKDINRMRDCY